MADLRFDRWRWQAGFGRDLSRIVLHDDHRSAALAASHDAYAVAREGEVFLGRPHPAGDLAEEVMTAHELAHALGSRTEPVAEQAGAAARARMHGRGGPAPDVRGHGGRGLSLHSCSREPSAAQRALDGFLRFTPALARDALTEYRALSDADRQKAVDRYYPSGGVQRLLAALPAADASGPFNDAVQDMLRRVQRSATLTSATASGMPNETAMAITQFSHMHAENLKLAQAATGTVSPTPAQVQAQQSTQVAATSIAPSTSVLTPAQVAMHAAATHSAVSAVVAYAAAHHPGLHLTAADFVVDIVGLENRGAGVIAYGDVVGGRRVAVVGRTFTRFVQANPAYALSVVVHELHGHPEYGPYGTPGSEYGLTLYDQAAAMLPGYTQPTGQGRTSEIDAYAYQETEIYSLLRSLPYHTPLAAKDAALQPDYVDPEPTVVARLQIVQRQWEPRVAKALVRGMYERFRLDPRLAPAALSAFRRSVGFVFGADAKEILK
jgi:hypothetical protein